MNQAMFLIVWKIKETLIKVKCKHIHSHFAYINLKNKLNPVQTVKVRKLIAVDIHSSAHP